MKPNKPTRNDFARALGEGKMHKEPGLAKYVNIHRSSPSRPDRFGFWLQMRYPDVFAKYYKAFCESNISEKPSW